MAVCNLDKSRREIDKQRDTVLVWNGSHVYCFSCNGCKAHFGKLDHHFNAAISVEIPDGNSRRRISLLEYITQYSSLGAQSQQNQKIVKMLSTMLSEALHTDIVIEVRGESIPAHRAILASRSPVFKAMFESNMQESTSGIVRVDLVTPGGMRAFLACLYTQDVAIENMEGHEAEVLQAAEYYGVSDLKETVEYQMATSLPHFDVAAAVNSLKVAQACKAGHLEEACWKNITSHWIQVLRSPELKDLIKSDNEADRDLAVEVLQKLSTSHAVLST